MTLSNTYDWEYDGVALVDGATRSLVSAKVFDNPAIRSSDQERGGIDGEHPGQDLYGGRTIELDIEVWGDASTFWPSYTALLAAVRKRTAEAPLSFRLPGWPDLRTSARPRRVNGPEINVEHDLFMSRVKVQFKCTDPRIYSLAVSSALANLPTSTDGMGFPLAFPIDFGDVSQSNIILATNAGWYEAPWKAIITGPITNPKIEHVQTGKIMSLLGTVDAGQTLVIYSRPHSLILLNGTASRYNWLLDPSQWFMLVPGPNEVKLQGSSAGAPTMVLEWSSAWV